MSNPLKARVAAGQPTRALWLEADSPAMAEAAVYAGFKYVLIDNEHGPASHQATAHLVRAIQAAGGHPLIRVPGNDPVILKRTLELGINSIMVPQINTAAEAEAAVAACRYPPRGQRGFAGEIRAARYGLDPDYGARAHEDLFLMVQIESAAGVANIEQIAAVDGIDMVFIGPYDLSGSLGHLGQTNHPEVEIAIAAVEAAVRPTGIPLGTVPRAGKTVAALMTAGFKLVIFGSEIGIAINALRDEAGKDDPSWLG